MSHVNIDAVAKTIKIPIPEKEALALLLKVKPTADMPRQGKPRAKKRSK